MVKVKKLDWRLIPPFYERVKRDKELQRIAVARREREHEQWEREQMALHEREKINQ